MHCLSCENRGDDLEARQRIYYNECQDELRCTLCVCENQKSEPYVHPSFHTYDVYKYEL